MRIPFTNIEIRAKAVETRNKATPAPDDDFWYNDITPESSTGLKINEDSALRIACVWACIRVISESCASLPLHLYKVKGTDRTKAEDHPLYTLLHDSPNPLMTTMQWRETMLAHVLTWGNSYNQIIKDGTGKILSLWPLDPSKMEVKWDEDSSTVSYIYRLEKGNSKIFKFDDILQIAGLGFGGLTGYSVINYAKESLGLALAGELFGAKFFSNSAVPKGVLEHPNSLTPDAAERLRDSWTKSYAGIANSNKTILLEEGMKYNPLTMPLADAQFIELRKFQIEEICRIFRVPPPFIQDHSHSTFSNIEHLSIDFVVHTLRPWLVRIEQAMSMKLLSNVERKVYNIEHLVDGLLRGDQKSRYEAYSSGINAGWLNRNEVREKENMNPDSELDTFLQPLNMVEAGYVPPPPPAPVEPTKDPNIKENVDKILRRQEIGIKRALKAKDVEKEMEKVKEDIEKFKEEIFQSV